MKTGRCRLIAGVALLVGGQIKAIAGRSMPPATIGVFLLWLGCSVSTPGRP